MKPFFYRQIFLIKLISFQILQKVFFLFYFFIFYFIFFFIFFLFFFLFYNLKEILSLNSINQTLGFKKLLFKDVSQRFIEKIVISSKYKLPSQIKTENYENFLKLILHSFSTILFL
jgi:hypothetical protein